MVFVILFFPGLLIVSRESAGVKKVMYIFRPLTPVVRGHPCVTLLTCSNYWEDAAL